jgi:hypothetical protein
MPDTLDIKKVISTSTASVSLDDLNKKGFKQVKVLNQAVITRLIAEAVDRVLEQRQKEISKEERDKVIKEARGQFETMAKDRLQMIQNETARQKNELLSEAERLKNSLLESEKRVAMLEGQLAAAKENAKSDAAVEKVLEAVNQRLQTVSAPGDVSKIMLSLDTLSRRLSNMGSGGGGGGGGGGGADPEQLKDFVIESLFAKEGGAAVESNVNKVKVRQSKAGDVKGALAKLKKLQQGGEDGE